MILFWIAEGREKKEVLALTGFSLTNRALQAVCLSLGLEELLLSVTEDMQANIVGTLTAYEAAWMKDPNGAYWETVCDYKPLDVMEAIFGAVFFLAVA